VRRHKKLHDRAEYGCKTTLPDGCHVITHQSRMPTQKLAEGAASEALRDTRYNFISFSAQECNSDPYATIAVIAVREHRVCGLLVSRERECGWKAELADFAENHFHQFIPTKAEPVACHKRRTLDMIWVLKRHRNEGLAVKMVQALGDNCGVQAEEFAHLLPFTEAALKFWLARNLSPIYVVR
jgi:hypothetical protein